MDETLSEVFIDVFSQNLELGFREIVDWAKNRLGIFFEGNGVIKRATVGWQFL